MAEAMPSVVSFEDAGSELVAEMLHRDHRVVIRAGGSSMIPAIWPGDKIEIVPASAVSIGLGQVVFYSNDGRLYVHRIVAIDGPAIVTRGDALAVNDRPIARAEILGVASAVVRNGRSFPLAGRPPSYGARLLAFAIRNSSVARRLVLGLRARGRPWTTRRCPV